jgi:hypothetical protein
MLEILLPLAFAAAGSVVVAIQQILDRFGKVIRLLALLEEQNRRLEEKSNETLHALDELRRQDDNHGTRINDIERYLQCITANLDNPFVIRYDGNHYHNHDDGN